MQISFQANRLSGWTLKDNQLTHLEINLCIDNKHGILESFFNDLQRQAGSLQHLKVHLHKPSIDFVGELIHICKKLKTIDLDLDELDRPERTLTRSLETLQMIQEHTKWKELIFTSIDEKHQNCVDEIVANHPEISQLIFKYYSPLERDKLDQKNSLFPLLPFFNEITFKFDVADEPRTYKDLLKVNALHFEWITSKEERAPQLIELLNRAKNLKALKFNSEHAEFTTELIQEIFNAVPQIEELEVFLFFGRLFVDPDIDLNELFSSSGPCPHFNITEQLQLIKTLGTNLKKLILRIGSQDFIKIQELKFFVKQTEIFNDSSVRVIVGELSSALINYFWNQCLGVRGFEIETGCVWKN
jgi:hypothetical protein